jgi:hypothetical protein
MTDNEDLTSAGTPRCTGTTKSGTRCKAAAKLGTDRCSQHTEQDWSNPGSDPAADIRAMQAVDRRESNPDRAVGTTRIRINRGDVLVNTTPKREERKARKRAKAERRFNHEHSKAKGARLAKAAAKAARARDRARSA